MASFIRTFIDNISSINDDNLFCDKTYFYISIMAFSVCLIYFVNIYIEIINLKHNIVPEIVKHNELTITKINSKINEIKDKMFQIHKTVLKLKGNEYKQINENDFNNIDFTYSKIKLCIIDRSIITNADKLFYKKILLKLYKLLDNNVIINNTTFNIKDKQYIKNGYKWYPELGLSIQGKSSQDTLNEIIHQTKSLKIDFYIEIELNDNEIVKMDFEY